MRTFEITRWDGTRLVKFTISAQHIGEALELFTGGIPDWKVVSIIEKPVKL